MFTIVNPKINEKSFVKFLRINHQQKWKFLNKSIHLVLKESHEWPKKPFNTEKKKYIFILTKILNSQL